MTADDCEPPGASSVVVGGDRSAVTTVVAESVVFPAASVARATTVYVAPSVRPERSHDCEAKPEVATGDPMVVPDANGQLPPAQ